ncbi:MAG: helix-turn-helix domain-containing protein [Lachnospiraceae bacterium]|nr:helix-turn-helix domain-containing protein [Lachnospiraceae bacterium]
MSQIVYAGKHLLTFTVPCHVHTSWEFIYCTSGSGELLFNGRSVPYVADDIIIVPPMCHHQNVSESGFTNVYLNIQTTIIPQTDPFRIHDDSNHFIRDAFYACFAYFSRESNRNSYLLSAYADLIVHLVLDVLNTPILSPIVKDIVNMIINNYPDEGFQLDEYLHSLPFNYDYLRKLFKKEMSLTPHNYLLNTRLNAAAERLISKETRSISISDVAHYCGFHDPLYFSRLFKKKFGRSPSEYQLVFMGELNYPDNSDSMKIMT